MEIHNDHNATFGTIPDPLFCQVSELMNREVGWFVTWTHKHKHRQTKQTTHPLFSTDNFSFKFMIGDFSCNLLLVLRVRCQDYINFQFWLTWKWYSKQQEALPLFIQIYLDMCLSNVVCFKSVLLDITCMVVGLTDIELLCGEWIYQTLLCKAKVFHEIQHCMKGPTCFPTIAWSWF